MKKLVSIMLVALMLVSVFSLGVNAETAPAGRIGDLTGDFKIDVLDATYIQRILAKIYDSDKEKELFADVDQDGVITIFDATLIQRWVAKLVDNTYIGRWLNYDMHENDFYSDYESGMAMVGVPVTFTANVYAGSPISSYELYVDDVCVATSEINSITYTFDKPGEYDVVMHINAFYSKGSIGKYKFTVVQPYESDTPLFKTLYLTGKIQWGTITYDRDDMAVHADAIGGVAPYQYKFVFERPEDVSYESEIITTIQEYSEDNVYELEAIKYSEISDSRPGGRDDLECKLTVYIKDANGSVVSREMPIIYRGDVPIG